MSILLPTVLGAFKKLSEVSGRESQRDLQEQANYFKKSIVLLSLCYILAKGDDFK